MAALWVCLLLAVVITYSNHFHNSFHFDDTHTIQANPYIRDVRNIPLFFTDARTFSTLPANQSYRPLVTATLAIDYWVAGGLNPFWFHVSTFAWYVGLLAVTYLLFVRIMGMTRTAPANAYVALFAVAWYGLHPVSAETVNYVIQRADLQATLGVVAGLVAYAALPRWRHLGLYLAPALVGLLAKQSAVMFGPLLLVYVLLFETDWGVKPTPGRLSAPRHRNWDDLRLAVIQAIPAFALCGLYYLFQRAMTPKTFAPGAVSAVRYWLTQPIVLLHYVTAFFWPTDLSADTDRAPVSSALSEPVAIGVAFLVVYALAIGYAVRRRHLRPVAFGLSWFLIASLPTSLFPLAEVENDHRMFFPFVGLALAVSWAGWMWLERRWNRAARSLAHRAMVAGGLLCLLLAYAYGAHARNEVWRTDETLWRDVTIKSPHNGRGLMNYGLTLMAKGDYQDALRYFQNALTYTPNYLELHINLGIAYGQLGRDGEAETSFRRALAIAPPDAKPHFYYARWLRTRSRTQEAIAHLRTAIDMNAAFIQSRYLLMQIYSEQNDLGRLKILVEQTLSLFPGDRESASYLAIAANRTEAVHAAESEVTQKPSAEAFVNLSLRYWQVGRHDECIRAANDALRLRPDYAEAYNNIAAAYQSMGRWDEAMAAAQRALKIRPNFELARNNLAYATAQKARGQSR